MKSLNSNRIKFLVGGVLIIVAAAIMILSATQTTAQFFLTIEELNVSKEAYIGENLRVSGAVLGESIGFDPETGLLTFTLANIPGDEDEIEAMGGLETILHQAVIDPENSRLEVVYQGARPDMLRHEAQAIVTGTLNEQNVFVAEVLLLKCPSKYEAVLPEQVE